MYVKENKNLLDSQKKITRESIIDTAIKLYQQKSSAIITLDFVADRVGVSNKTFYNYFSSKEQLIFEIFNPVLNDGNKYLDMISEKEVIYMDDMWNSCLYLWKEYYSTLIIIRNIDFRELHTVLYIHTLFLKKFTETFARMQDLPGDLKIPFSKLAFIVIKSFIPLLSKLSDIEGYESLYKNAMNGMVKGFAQDCTYGND